MEPSNQTSAAEVEAQDSMATMNRANTTAAYKAEKALEEALAEAKEAEVALQARLRPSRGRGVG